MRSVLRFFCSEGLARQVENVWALMSIAVSTTIATPWMTPRLPGEKVRESLPLSRSPDTFAETALRCHDEGPI